MEYSIPKGLFDILPVESKPENFWKLSERWQYVESIIRSVANTYGFKEIRTPIFERTELFVRGVGESSDIVTKEMYTFLDKGERSMTLRPEGTAPTMRAFIENHLNQLKNTHKLFYIGPMFRYERPQSGRFRQHHQFGVEAIGSGKPEQDVEIIDMLTQLYKKLGLKNLNVMINSVGDDQSRTLYRQKLSSYLEPFYNQLSPESQVRFSKNVLRILDSKDAHDQEILKDAPLILDCLSEDAVQHFNEVKKLLSLAGISFVENSKLVRGLDYYNKTVFEIVSADLGAQNSIGGGGRYDGLIASLGGPDLPAVGYATGLERVLQIMDKQNAKFPEPSRPLCFIIPIGDAARKYCFELLCQFRHEEILAEMDFSGKKLQHSLQLASASNAGHCILIGEEELARLSATIKNLNTRETIELPLTDVISYFKNLKRLSHV